jgi:uncharacterized repeat protein (TIGR02543 family)
MRKKAWFFKNGTAAGMFGVMLIFAVFAAGCSNGSTDTPSPATYTVVFDTDNGDSAVESQVVRIGGKVARPASNPVKEGHTFADWHRDAEKKVLWNFGTDVVVQDTTIYAKWVEGTVSSHMVTFDASGGGKVSPQSVVQGEKAREPAKPAKSGYIFGGWLKDADGNLWDFDTDTVAQTVALKAKWTKAVTIAFNANGGSTIPDVTVAEGGSLPLDNYRPTRAGHVFEGWYREEALNTPAGDRLENIAATITLHAKWTGPSELKDYLGVWRSGSEAYLLQADGTAWRFSSSPNSPFSFRRHTWSTTRIDGTAVVFNAGKTEFASSNGDHPVTYAKTEETKETAAATGALLETWVNSYKQTVTLNAAGTAALSSAGNTITLNYSAEGDAVSLLAPAGNVVIASIGITNNNLNGFSKPTSDTSLAGIWKLTENNQEFYWTLKADGSGTFHTLGASMPVKFIVTEDKRIDGRSYTVSGDTLTFPSARWDQKQQDYVDVVLAKATGIPSGSDADGDPRMHGAWKTTLGGETITITIGADGVATQSREVDSASSIWKADGRNFYTYNPGFNDSRDGYPQAYSISGSTLTLRSREGRVTALTR